MGNVFEGIPPKLMSRLALQYSLKIFVETGTGNGKSAQKAIGYFNYVYTVENSKRLFKKSTRLLAHNSQVTVCNGDSREFLIELVPSLNNATMFWLDAHFSGRKTSGSVKDCPLIDEIEIINSLITVEHVILVDDVTFFNRVGGTHNWPLVSKIKAVLRAGNRNISEDDGVILAVPLEKK